MNVIIKIEGREAIPVRAIPLLTDWQTVTPDFLAQALSGDKHYFCFMAMQAYRFVNGEALPRRWWANYVSEPLQALGDEIRATETTDKTGKEQWKHESLKKLPAGVYVWRDEFALAHQRHFGRTALPQDFEGKDVQLTDAESAKLTAEHQEHIALDYAPFINDELRALVMEGFPSDAGFVANETPAPVVVAGASESVTQRRARYLALLEAEEKHGKRGALTRVANSEGVDRANMKKDIDKARDARTAQTRAGAAWPSQLVKDGKRTG